jgi:hypothetical protein
MRHVDPMWRCPICVLSFVFALALAFSVSLAVSVVIQAMR